MAKKIFYKRSRDQIAFSIGKKTCNLFYLTTYIYSTLYIMYMIYIRICTTCLIKLCPDLQDLTYILKTPCLTEQTP